MLQLAKFVFRSWLLMWAFPVVMACVVGLLMMIAMLMIRIAIAMS